MPTLLVMAAGLGSRYGGPKQTEIVGPSGETLLDYALYDAHRAGFRRIVFVVRKDLTRAFADLVRRLPAGVEIAWVYQDAAPLPDWFTPPPRTRPWGTAQAVLAARSVLDAPFATINADDFYGQAAYVIAMAECERARTEDAYSVIGRPLSSTLSAHGPVARAICSVDRDGWVTAIEEVQEIRRADGSLAGITARGRRELTGAELASMNLWTFAPEVLARLRERFDEFLREHGADPAAEWRLPDAIGELIRHGTARVRGIEAPGPWFGLTHPDDRGKVVASLAELHAQGEYPTPVWGIKTL
jgi:NDP-sugar pyrophosphorylase family protein